MSNRKKYILGHFFSKKFTSENYILWGAIAENVSCSPKNEFSETKSTELLPPLLLSVYRFSKIVNRNWRHATWGGQAYMSRPEKYTKKNYKSKKRLSNAAESVLDKGNLAHEIIKTRAMNLCYASCSQVSSFFSPSLLILFSFSSSLLFFSFPFPPLSLFLPPNFFVTPCAIPAFGGTPGVQAQNFFTHANSPYQNFAK